jgi:hypothetical protein
MSVALLIGETTYAASILEFDRWMQRVEKKMLSVQKHIQRKNTESAASEAKEIEELYRLMQLYFENSQIEKIKDADKAIVMFREGREAAAQMAAHAAAGNFENAQASAKLIARDCKACHKDYKPLD